MFKRMNKKPLSSSTLYRGLSKSVGGRYWDRTSDLFRVKEAFYR